MRAAKPRLIAVDGVDAAAVLTAARRALGSPSRGGISHWDASGVFQDLIVAEENAGAPSPRTLLLLYAADLAFRLRWEIRPALAEGQTVVAAPYVETAVAFGRAAGLPAGWLANLFRFAPRAADRLFVPRPSASTAAGADGFVGFVCTQMNGGKKGRVSRRMVRGTAAQLRRAALRANKRRLAASR
jgi:hypothetical protein